MEPYLDETAYHDTPNCTFPFGTHIAIVEIDEETGTIELVRYVAVDDVGKKINPMIVDGQLHGGIAQGVGQALWEGAVYSDDGQLLTGSMLDYALPRASWLPSFELDETVTPSPVNPLGVKGVGEAGCIASTAAVANAVIDALSPLGIRHLDMPYTAQKVWGAIQGASNGARREARHDPGGVRVHPGGQHRGRARPLAGDDGAKVIAGGQSLLPLLKLRLASAETLVDIGRLSELRGIEHARRRPAVDRRADHVRRAASTRPAVHYGVLRDALPTIGDVQVRNRGTVGGAVAHADPASDLPAVAPRARRGDRAPVLGAGRGRSRPTASSRARSRRRCGHDELLTRVILPAPRDDAGSAYASLEQPASGYAMVGVAAVVFVGAGNVIEWAGIGDHRRRRPPVPGDRRSRRRCRAPTGRRTTSRPRRRRSSAARRSTRTSTPTAEYRSAMAVVYTRRAIQAALARLG